MKSRYLFLLLASGLVATALWGQPAATDEFPSVESEGGRHLLVTLPQQPSRPLQYAGSSPRGYRGRGYKTSQRVKRVAARLAKAYGLRRVDEWPIQALDVHCVVYEVPPGRPLEEVLERLRRDVRVESAQPMNIFRVMAQAYDDPYLDLQHGLQSMQIESAHDWADGDGVRVAIVDTGVDVSHPELEGRIAAAENFVDDDARRFTTDVHGTAVAGVIASAANNGIGIVGVAPAVRILALKACWAEETGSIPAYCTTFTLAKALSYAIARRPHVLNLSLAGPADPLLARLLARAIERGIVVVTASAPEAGSEAVFPAAMDRVIAVTTAVAGTVPGRRGLPALNAPGDEVFTTVPHGAYDFLSGSSLAAAHVSGLVALLLEHDRSLPTERIVALLRETGGETARGVNGCRALIRLLGSGGCPEPSPASLAGY